MDHCNVLYSFTEHSLVRGLEEQLFLGNSPHDVVQPALHYIQYLSNSIYVNNTVQYCITKCTLMYVRTVQCLHHVILYTDVSTYFAVFTYCVLMSVLHSMSVLSTDVSTEQYLYTK